jgi:hypothetical protein
MTERMRSENLMRYFEYQHLPQKLQHVSRHFAVAADVVLHILPEGPEKTACLRKLLEAKDCAVRAALDLPDL